MQEILIERYFFPYASLNQTTIYLNYYVFSGFIWTNKKYGIYIYVNLLILHQTTKKLQIVFVHEKGIANTRVNFSTGEHLQYWITIFSAKDASKQKPDSIP